MSPSSRRAWIEMYMTGAALKPYDVALLTEGVDRNMYAARNAARNAASPSSRRAWIEMCWPRSWRA